MSRALKWEPPQSLDSTAATPEEKLSHRPPKRKRQRPPTPTAFPEVVFIDDDTSDDGTIPNVVDAVILSPPSPLSIQDDDTCRDLKRGPFPTADDTIHSLQLDKYDDGPSLNALFDQFLRSPSPPLLPDGAPSSRMRGRERGTSRQRESSQCREWSPHSTAS